MQDVFWHLGSQILNLAHKGTIFEQSIKLNAKDGDEDNLDILHATANKLNIIRPILRPKIKESLTSILKGRCADALKDVMATFIPCKKQDSKRAGNGENDLKMEKEMEWLMKLIPSE